MPQAGSKAVLSRSAQRDPCITPNTQAPYSCAHAGRKRAEGCTCSRAQIERGIMENKNPAEAQQRFGCTSSNIADRLLPTPPKNTASHVHTTIGKTTFHTWRPMTPAFRQTPSGGPIYVVLQQFYAVQWGAHCRGSIRLVKIGQIEWHHLNYWKEGVIGNLSTQVLLPCCALKAKHANWPLRQPGCLMTLYTSARGGRDISKGTVGSRSWRQHKHGLCTHAAFAKSAHLQSILPGNALHFVLGKLWSIDIGWEASMPRKWWQDQLIHWMGSSR